MITVSVKSGEAHVCDGIFRESGVREQMPERQISYIFSIYLSRKHRSLAQQSTIELKYVLLNS